MNHIIKTSAKSTPMRKTTHDNDTSEVINSEKKLKFKNRFSSILFSKSSFKKYEAQIF